MYEMANIGILLAALTSLTTGALGFSSRSDGPATDVRTRGGGGIYGIMYVHVGPHIVAGLI
jgi:hypothetical protein